MTAGYTHMSVVDVEDAAQKFGMSDSQETRFAHGPFGAQQTGFTFHRYKPGKRQPFGHRHDAAEEVYFVVSGSGRAKLDDDVVELNALEALRVSPGVMRAFEAGSKGMEVLAFGPRHAEDRGEIVPGWWTD